MRLATFAVLCVLSVLAARAALGEAPAPATPAGLWKTFNDRTGQADGLVRVRKVGEAYEVKVEAVFSPPAPSPTPLCELCPGALKDQPVVGMTIARLQADGERWSGEILDPDEGKRYRCTVRLLEGGRKLEVRGYVGLPLFGRSEIWQRMP